MHCFHSVDTFPSSVRIVAFPIFFDAAPPEYPYKLQRHRAANLHQFSLPVDMCIGHCLAPTLGAVQSLLFVDNRMLGK